MNKIDQAINPNTPPEVLEFLATDGDYWISYWAARNPNSNELIRRLVLMGDHGQN